MRNRIKVEYLLHIEIQLKAFIKRCENVGFIYRKNMAGQPAFLLLFFYFLSILLTVSYLFLAESYKTR